jgi:predicted site-specific integrase-resolvase
MRQTEPILTDHAAWLSRHRISAREWAEIVGVALSTVQRWGSGDLALPPQQVLWMRAVDADPDLLERLRGIAAARDGRPVRRTSAAGRKRASALAG